ncbi:hypothetical protein MMC25_003663 [Agyrium rufum]|nr:hypothetical protein [Agyrium rufum]
MATFDPKLSELTPSSTVNSTGNGQRVQRVRLSAFKEMLEDDHDQQRRTSLASKKVRFPSEPTSLRTTQEDSTYQHIKAPQETKKGNTSTLPVIASPSSTIVTSSSNETHRSRRYLLTLLFALLVPIIHFLPPHRTGRPALVGVSGGPIPAKSAHVNNINMSIGKRQNSPTDICTRWSQQTAIVNGTVYIYGGRATQDYQQTTDEWNNDFLTLDLTKTWQITTPTIQGLPQPSLPPAVANGFLWSSFESLFLYGGEYSDTPTQPPTAPFSLWEYKINSSQWVQHENPTTSEGTNSDPGNQPVQSAAEGAGISVPELGRGFWFGGHQDFLTTYQWSYHTPRIYLKSLVEFTFPGYANTAVQSLSNGQLAGTDGVWRNVTQGGTQDSHSFPERADTVLVYIPGFSDQGILLGLAGGTNESYTELNLIDVYDIAGSSWYKQATSGPTPKFRVNPCAVAASAPDGSSINVYMFAGQTLLPQDNQTVFNDMWILTLPSFTWIEVDQTGQSVPPGRAGHSCNIWDGQMIVIGGELGQAAAQGGSVSCDPGFYVYDASQLKWQNSFTALNGSDNQNQQVAQSKNASGLSGSYGYQVPALVQSVVGGSSAGGATVTAPAITATSGPLATGKPITYTVTVPSEITYTSSGVVVTQTATAPPPGSSSQSQASTGPNIGAIVAGVVAGFFAILAGYLGFCVYVYRRQLALYKNHVTMAQRAAVNGGAAEKQAFLGATISNSAGSDSAQRGKYSTDASSAAAASSAKRSGNSSSAPPVPGAGYPPGSGHDSTANSSSEDLLLGQEPTFVGVLLNPRRSLRVINRD